MNSSARTEVFSSTSTRSMAMVGTSASMVRRRELAKARSTFSRTKSARSGKDCRVRAFPGKCVVGRVYSPLELLLEARPRRRPSPHSP